VQREKEEGTIAVRNKKVMGVNGYNCGGERSGMP